MEYIILPILWFTYAGLLYFTNFTVSYIPVIIFLALSFIVFAVIRFTHIKQNTALVLLVITHIPPSLITAIQLCMLISPEVKNIHAAIMVFTLYVLLTLAIMLTVFQFVGDMNDGKIQKIKAMAAGMTTASALFLIYISKLYIVEVDGLSDLNTSILERFQTISLVLLLMLIPLHLLLRRYSKEIKLYLAFVFVFGFVWSLVIMVFSPLTANNEWFVGLNFIGSFIAMAVLLACECIYYLIKKILRKAG